VPRKSPSEVLKMLTSRHAAVAACVVMIPVIAPAGALDTAFDLLTEGPVVSGPPYPTVPHRIEVAHVEPLSTEADGEMRLRLELALVEEQGVIPARLRITEQEGNEDGTASSLDVRVSCPDEIGANSLPGRAVLRLQAELLSRGSTPARLLAVRPELPVTDPLRFFDVATSPDSLRITFLIEFLPGIRHGLTLAGRSGPSLSVSDVDISVIDRVSDCRADVDRRLEGSFFLETADAVFDLTVTLEGEAGGSPNAMVALTARGDFLSGPSCVESSSWGRVKSSFRD
jgi:hypothetical protein